MNEPLFVWIVFCEIVHMGATVESIHITEQGAKDRAHYCNAKEPAADIVYTIMRWEVEQ